MIPAYRFGAETVRLAAFRPLLRGQTARAMSAMAPAATSVTTQNCQSPHGIQPTALTTPYTIAAAM